MNTETLYTDNITIQPSLYGVVINFGRADHEQKTVDIVSSMGMSYEQAKDLWKRLGVVVNEEQN